MEDTELRVILTDYADRLGSPYINKDEFYKELSTNVIYRAQKDKRWEAWARRTRDKFDTDLKQLVAEGTCSVQKNSGVEYIYLPEFFVNRVRAAWNNIETHDSEIFPNEKKIKLSPPNDMLKTFIVGDLINLLRNPQKEEVPLVRVSFKTGLGNMILLAPFVESRLLDGAIAKVRRCLIKKDTRVFCLQRIRSVFPDRFMQANTIIDLIIKNPISCTSYMQNGDENAFMIWIKLCEFIKESVQIEGTPPEETDIAVQQGAEIIEVYNNYYREIAAEKHEKEQIMNELYEALLNPPYFWILTEIYKIQMSNGKPIIEMLSHEMISDYVLKHTHDTGDSIIQPPMLIFYDEFREKCFARKETVFAGLGSLISKSRKAVFELISRRWHKVIKNYLIDPAMKSDIEFETLMIKTVKKIKPFVVILHEDVKLKLLRKEFSSHVGADSGEKFFYGNEVKSLTALYDMDRHAIIHNIKLTLPFWYSVPILTAVIRLFKGRSRIKLEDTED